MAKFLEDAEKSFKDAYHDAIRSNQDNFFEHSLLACALATTNDEGFFTANDVVEPYSAIIKEKKRIAHFEKHLIPSLIDQNRCAHWRNPMDMIFQG
jgi:hypothetical protein